MALNPLVSLFGYLVVRSSRIKVDRHTDGRTDGQNDYCNPRCACAPRVNELHYICTNIDYYALPYTKMSVTWLFLPLVVTQWNATCMCVHNTHVQCTSKKCFQYLQWNGTVPAQMILRKHCLLFRFISFRSSSSKRPYWCLEDSDRLRHCRLHRWQPATPHPLS